MSVLPTKYVEIEYSMIGLTSIVIESLRPNDSISTLWDRLSNDERIRTFDRLVDAITLGFAGGMIDMKDGVFVVSSSQRSEQ